MGWTGGEQNPFEMFESPYLHKINLHFYHGRFCSHSNVLFMFSYSFCVLRMRGHTSLLHSLPVGYLETCQITISYTLLFLPPPPPPHPHTLT